MIYLILTIILSTAVFVIMRLFGRFNLDNHQALTWNYATSACIGFAMSAASGTLVSPTTQPWFVYALLTGFSFILTYALIAESSQRSGVTVTSLSSKLSVVIPVLYGICIGQRPDWMAYIGITLAIVALILVVGGKDKGEAKAEKTILILLLPVFIFLSTGIGDVLISITENANTGNKIPMIAFIYFVSFLFGVILVAYDLISGKSKWQWKSALGGLVLGTINFFSTVCIYRALGELGELRTVVFFPVYNIGVVCLSALSGWLLFKEKLGWKKVIGLAIAIIAVILITVKP